jgi:hypothetical protein
MIKEIKDVQTFLSQKKPDDVDKKP